MDLLAGEEPMFDTGSGIDVDVVDVDRMSSMGASLNRRDREGIGRSGLDVL